MVKERIGSTVIYSIDEGDLLWPLCRRRGSDQDHTHIGKVIANHDTPTHLSPFSFLFFFFRFYIAFCRPYGFVFTSCFYFARESGCETVMRNPLKCPHLYCNGIFKKQTKHTPDNHRKTPITPKNSC